MANDNGLIDEYEKLQKIKKEIEAKEGELKKDIIKLANEKNTSILFGTFKKCSIKEYTKVIYPEDKTSLVEMIREKGLYDEFSSINYFKLRALKRAAQFYLSSKKLGQEAARIDAVSVILDDSGTAKIEHFPNITGIVW